MKEFIENIVKHLVNKPENVHIDQIIGEYTTVLEMHVESSDIGKVIGRNGQMANSLRTLLAAASAKQNKKKYVLEIITAPKKERSKIF